MKNHIRSAARASRPQGLPTSVQRAWRVPWDRSCVRVQVWVWEDSGCPRHRPWGAAWQSHRDAELLRLSVSVQRAGRRSRSLRACEVR